MSTVIPKYTDRLQNSSNFWLEVARGTFADMQMVVKWGENLTVPNGAWEMITASSVSSYPWPQAATTIRVKAGGDAADAAAGAGAQTIRVYGLDENLALAEEDITLNANGTLASASTTTTFFRVFRALVLTTGTYGGKNTAAITIEDTAGSNDLLLIEAAEAQTQHCAYSIPAGYTGYMLGWEAHIQATKPADVRICFRENLSDVTTPFSPTRVVFIEHGVEGETQNQPTSVMAVLPGGSDIWIEAEGGGAATQVSAAMEILLVKDEDTTVTTNN